MNTPRKITLVLLLAALTGAASAQQAHSQVKADLAAARRNGDMLATGELGLTQRELRPDLYPSAPVVGKTRAQVKSELAAAIRNGDLIAAGESGAREKDLNPGMYPADPVVAGKTRAQVKSELAAAIRDGDMLAPGESGMTEYQLHPQQYAHQRAIDAAKLARHSAPQASDTAAN